MAQILRAEQVSARSRYYRISNREQFAPCDNIELIMGGEDGKQTRDMLYALGWMSQGFMIKEFSTI